MDRISGLPDELLIKILLFVPTKVVVTTSVLSKRWEFLWMWLPKLKYGHMRSSASECERLQCFLNKNLPLHRAPVIKRFNLLLHCSHIKPEDIRMWVVVVISHYVRKLDIYAWGLNEPIILPSNLYTCKSLVILKLDGEILLDVPRMVFLPSLKTLKIEYVRYSNEESLQRLLYNCPILEDLSVHLREYVITRKLTVAFPSLQSLTLCIDSDHDTDGIVIDTPSLEYLTLRDDCVKNHYCLIENMPNLIEADVVVALPYIKSFIGSITSVERLGICSEATYDEDFVFNQLKHLQLCRCKEHSANLLARLLKDSPNLQLLDLFVMEDHYYYMFDWNQPSNVPACILSSLQTLNLYDYHGAPRERDFVVYILQNAVHLKTARIKSVKCQLPKSEMIKELELYSRASTTCQVIFD